MDSLGGFWMKFFFFFFIFFNLPFFFREISRLAGIQKSTYCYRKQA